MCWTELEFQVAAAAVQCISPYLHPPPPHPTPPQPTTPLPVPTSLNRANARAPFWCTSTQGLEQLHLQQQGVKAKQRRQTGAAVSAARFKASMCTHVSQTRKKKQQTTTRCLSGPTAAPQTAQMCDTLCDGIYPMAGEPPDQLGEQQNIPRQPAICHSQPNLCHVT
jgi:hypothetical protein